MDTITRTPSASSPKESPHEIEKKSLLDNLETVPAEDLIEDLHNITTELFLGTLPEPSPLSPPSTPKREFEEPKVKEVQSSDASLHNELEKKLGTENSVENCFENFFERQVSSDSQNSLCMWNTGYFSDLGEGSGDLWKDRSVWASHPSVFETRKKEAAKISMENRVVGHNCSVLFWGW